MHDGEFIPDNEGMEFPGWAEASHRAIGRASEAMIAHGDRFWSGEHIRVVVTDSLGKALYELRVSGHRVRNPDVAAHVPAAKPN